MTLTKILWRSNLPSHSSRIGLRSKRTFHPGISSVKRHFLTEVNRLSPGHFPPERPCSNQTIWGCWRSLARHSSETDISEEFSPKQLVLSPWFTQNADLGSDFGLNSDSEPPLRFTVDLTVESDLGPISDVRFCPLGPTIIHPVVELSLRLRRFTECLLRTALTVFFWVLLKLGKKYAIILLYAVSDGGLIMTVFCHEVNF